MKREKKQISHAGTGHTCGECRHGQWIDDKDYQGNSFAIHCKYATWAINRIKNIGVCLDVTPACSMFEHGEKIDNNAGSGL